MSGCGRGSRLICSTAVQIGDQIGWLRAHLSLLKRYLILRPLGHIVPLNLRLSVRSIAGDLAGDDLGDVALFSCLVIAPVRSLPSTDTVSPLRIPRA